MDCTTLERMGDVLNPRPPHILYLCAMAALEGAVMNPQHLHLANQISQEVISTFKHH